ncbi:hypothetical protein JL09_g5165 [Pichia kudriavzevii]|uniref:Uncharacterized protein n=1 Tax=Pichia kudriavzevii TaxID=4909 RepID=A0A099NSV0_PICKU|nr:hypothetical protein JL09_g5165 [Pichia kudriavzevii]
MSNKDTTVLYRCQAVSF